MTASEYEFTQEENHILQALSKRTARVGILLALIGAATALNGVGSLINRGVNAANISLFFMAAIQIVIGIVIWRPADNLKRIVTAKGSDITELMTALNEYGNGFGIAIILILINLIPLVIQIVQIFRQ